MVLPKENVTERTMAIDEKMSVDERYKYLRMMQKRYKKAAPEGKSELLDEMEAVTGQHRKYLIRQMNRQTEINRLEAKLQELKEQNTTRVANKDSIVEKRLNELTGGRNVLEW